MSWELSIPSDLFLLSRPANVILPAGIRRSKVWRRSGVIDLQPVLRVPINVGICGVR